MRRARRSARTHCFAPPSGGYDATRHARRCKSYDRRRRPNHDTVATTAAGASTSMRCCRCGQQGGCIACRGRLRGPNTQAMKTSATTQACVAHRIARKSIDCPLADVTTQTRVVGNIGTTVHPRKFVIVCDSGPVCGSLQYVSCSRCWQRECCFYDCTIEMVILFALIGSPRGGFSLGQARML